MSLAEIAAEHRQNEDEGDEDAAADKGQKSQPTGDTEEHEDGHQVGDHQRPNQRPNQIQVGHHQVRPRLDAEHDKGAHKDGHARAPGYAEEQGRQQRSALIRIVRGFRRDHALDGVSGQLLTGSFMDYAMRRADDLTWFEVESNPVPTAINPLGVKGAGEAGVSAHCRR